MCHAAHWVLRCGDMSSGAPCLFWVQLLRASLQLCKLHHLGLISMLLGNAEAA